LDLGVPSASAPAELSPFGRVLEMEVGWPKPPPGAGIDMTQLAALTLTKAQLDRIPSDERLFYFMAGQLHNDINILTKLLTAAIKELKLVEKEPPKRSGANAQVLLLLKLTAGRLYEGHKMIGETFSAKGFLKKYKADMTPLVLNNLYAMNTYFGGKNAIQHIRTKLAFHLDAKSIAAAYASAPPEFKSVEYLAKNYNGHNLFHTSETLALIAMVGDGIENWQDTIDRIVGEITETCVTMAAFLMGFIGLLLVRFLGLKTEQLEAVTITITDDLSIDDVRLPFFCLPPRSRP
jgi:hypothetical protein